MTLKKWVATIIILFFWIGGVYRLYQEPYNICVNYDLIEDGKVSQLFYAFDDEEWSEEDSFDYRIQNGAARFSFTENLFEQIYAFRLDPVKEETDEFAIKDIRFYKGRIPIKIMSAEELWARITWSYDVELSYRSDRLYMSTQNDPMLVFENDFEMKWKSKVIGCYTIFEAIILLLVFFLFKLIRLLFRKVIELIKRFSFKKKIDDIYSKILLVLDYIESKPKRITLILIGVFTCLILVLFWRYLFGKCYWFFTGIASDSYGQIYPVYYNAARRIREGCIAAGWDFYRGLGNSIGRIELGLNSWILYFGEDVINYLNSINYILKICLSGLLFYEYLKLLGRKRVTCLIGSLGYMFCGHMIIRGRWEDMPREVVLIAVLLLCTELYIKNKDIRWLPLGIIFFVTNTGEYPIVLYTIVFSGYIIFRYFSEREFEIKDFVRYLLGFVYCALIVLPIVAGRVEGIIGNVESNRFEKGMESFSDTIVEKKEWLIGWKYIQSAFYRTIGNSIVGVEENEFSGMFDTLSDPTFYCGIAPLLALPMAFKGENKKKKYWYAGALIIVALYFFIVPVRLLASGMTGDSSSFKISSFWIIVLFLYMGTDGLDNLWDGKATIRQISITIGILVATGVTFAIFLNPDIIWRYLLYSFAFIILYGIMFRLYLKRDMAVTREGSIIKGLIICTCICEVIFTTYSYINTPKAIKNDGARTGLNDYSIEALAYIAENDQENIYRIDKQYESYGRNDSLYQNYMGTRSYIGGLGERKLTVEMYEELALPKLGIGTMLGMSISDEMNTLAGVKYILTTDKAIANYGYKYKNDINGIKIYENSYALPFVYGYRNYMYRDDFDKLTVQEKRDALLKYCVIEKETDGIKLDYFDGEKEQKRKLLDEYAVEWVKEDGMVNFPENGKDDVLAVAVRFSNVSGGKDSYYNYVDYYGDEISKEIKIGIPQDGGEIILTFNVEGINSLGFGLNDDIQPEILQIAQIPQEIYYEYYVNCIDNLRSINAENIYIDKKNNSVEGRIRISEPTEVCFAVPYDEAWHLKLNGEEVETEQLNIGYIGAYVEDGEYEFELKYIPEDDSISRYVEYAVYILAFLNICICSLIYRKRNANNKDGRRWG